jgi:hypothetical protein
MGTIQSYPPPTLPLAGDELLAAWQNGKQVALSASILAGGFIRLDINAAALTLDASHASYRLVFQSACSVTVPADLPANWECQWAQMGAGPVSFVAGAGMVINSDNGSMASAARYALGTLWVDAEGHAVLAGGI